MVTIDEAKKEICVCEVFNIDTIKYLSKDFCEDKEILMLTDNECWEILKNIADKANYLSEPITENLIENEIYNYLADKEMN